MTQEQDKTGTPSHFGDSNKMVDNATNPAPLYNSDKAIDTNPDNAALIERAKSFLLNYIPATGQEAEAFNIINDLLAALTPPTQAVDVHNSENINDKGVCGASMQADNADLIERCQNYLNNRTHADPQSIAWGLLGECVAALKAPPPTPSTGNQE